MSAVMDCSIASRLENRGLYPRRCRLFSMETQELRIMCPQEDSASLFSRLSFHRSNGAKERRGSCPNQRYIASAYPRRVRACDETVLKTSPIDAALCSMAQTTHCATSSACRVSALDKLGHEAGSHMSISSNDDDPSHGFLLRLSTFQSHSGQWDLYNGSHHWFCSTLFLTPRFCLSPREVAKPDKWLMVPLVDCAALYTCVESFRLLGAAKWAGCMRPWRQLL